MSGWKGEMEMTTGKLGPCPLCGGKLTFDPGDSETLCLECHIAMDARGLGRLSAIAAQNKRMREALERIMNTCRMFDGCPVGPDTIAELCEEALKR